MEHPSAAIALEIEALEQRLARAWVEGDRCAIDEMLADDWATTDLTGALRSKHPVLKEMFAATDRPIRAMAIDEVNVRVLGRIALVTGRTAAAGPDGHEVRLRFTDVLEHRAGRWLFIASQGTLLGGGRRDSAEPILPARNLTEVRAFYGRLGFAAWFGDDPRWQYEIVSRRGLVVHFFADADLVATKNDAGCYWRVEDADRLHQELAALDLPGEGVPRLTSPVDQPWGMREFTLVDPSGNLVRIGHELGR